MDEPQLIANIDDEILIEKVRTPENLQLLEHIIYETYTKDYKPLFKEKEKFSYGKEIGKKDLKRVLDESKNDVDKFFGINHDLKPEIVKKSIFALDDYTFNIWFNYMLGSFVLGMSAFCVTITPTSLLNWAVAGGTSLFGIKLLKNGRAVHKKINESDGLYDTITKKIRVDIAPPLNNEVMAKSIVDHEYSHFLIDILVLKDVPLDSKLQSEIFEEGFAENIQRIMGNKRYKEEGNPAHFFYNLKRHIKNLKFAYLDAAQHMPFKPSESLLNETFLDFYDITRRNFSENLDMLSSAYGDALFRLAEQRHGNKVYRRALVSDFSFF